MNKASSLPRKCGSSIPTACPSKGSTASSKTSCGPQRQELDFRVQYELRRGSVLARGEYRITIKFADEISNWLLRSCEITALPSVSKRFIQTGLPWSHLCITCAYFLPHSLDSHSSLKRSRSSRRGTTSPTDSAIQLPLQLPQATGFKVCRWPRQFLRLTGR